MKNFLLQWDPYRQSCFFFKTSRLTWLMMFALVAWLTWKWKSGLADTLLNNIFVYAPNYLTHEMLGHNLVGNIFYRALYSSAPGLGNWIATLAGNGVETLIPLGLVLFFLRLDGGRWMLPPLLYWLASTFYGAGVYAQDARACSLPLTSSDMMTNYKPGEICGDWHHILEPLGLLNYDQWIAYTFLFIGSFLCILAVYSAWYYWMHTEQYTHHHVVTTQPVSDDWTPPNIYTPREENFPGGKQE